MRTGMTRLMDTRNSVPTMGVVAWSRRSTSLGGMVEVDWKVGKSDWILGSCRAEGGRKVRSKRQVHAEMG